MAKKHSNKITTNGRSYVYPYRRQASYKGQTRRFNAKTKTEWEAKVEAWKHEVDSSVLNTDPKMTVSQIAELFHKDALASARPKTIEERESKLRIYIVPAIGHLKLRDVTNADIEPIYEKAEDVSASTLAHVNKVCHRMFEFAVENEYVITKNPISKGLTKRVKRIVASSNQTTDADDFGLGLEDIDALLMESKGKPFEIIIQWQVLHGLRIEEALGMMWDDIDFVKDTIGIYRAVSDTPRSTVKGSKWDDDGVGPIITPPKTLRSRRIIPLQAETKSLLEQTPVEERQGYIYATADGTPFYPTNYRKRVFTPFREQLGLDTMLPHDLRKAFGSVLIINGTDIMTVSRWMGHSSPEVTLRIYAKVLPEAEKWHSDTISKALFR